MIDSLLGRPLSVPEGFDEGEGDLVPGDVGVRLTALVSRAAHLTRRPLAAAVFAWAAELAGYASRTR